MFCMKCGSQTDNGDGVCDNCKSNAPVESTKTGDDSTNITNTVSEEKKNSGDTTTSNASSSNISTNNEPTGNTSTGNASVKTFFSNHLKFQITKEDIINAGFISVLALLISFVLSFIISLVINISSQKYITTVLSEILDLSGNKVKVNSAYSIWRMSFFNTFMFKSSGLLSMNVVLGIRYIILVLVPFVSFLLSWRLFNNSNVRSKLPKLFGKQEAAMNVGQIFKTNIVITAFITVFFMVTSFIPIILFKSNDEYYGMKVFYKFTFLSSVILTAIVVLITNLVLMLIRKEVSIKDLKLPSTAKESQVELLSLTKLVVSLYKKYLLQSVVATAGILIVLIFRQDLWKELLLIITLLPNLILIVMNMLTSGTFEMSNIGDSESLLALLQKPSKIAFILLTICFLIVLAYRMITIFLSFTMEDKKKYWIKVSKFSGIIFVTQLCLYYLANIGIKVTVEREGSQSIHVASSLIVLILILLLVCAISGAVACYLPKNISDKIWHQKENSNSNKKEFILIASFFVLTILLSIIITGKHDKSPSYKNTSSSSDDWDYDYDDSYSDNDSYEAAYQDPYSVSSFNNGYIFNDYSSYYFYKDNEITKLKLEMDTYYENTYYSPTADKILVDKGNKLMLINSEGKELFKQEITYDSILAFTEDFNQVAFWFDNEVTLYNSKENEFTTLDLSYSDINSQYGTAVFNKNGDTLYLVGSKIVAYDIDSDKETVLYEEAPVYYIMNQNVYVVEEAQSVPKSLIDNTTLSYGIQYNESSYNNDIIQYTEDGSKVCLSNLSNVNPIGTTSFLVNFNNSSDTFVYDVKSDDLTNISAEIRYLSMKTGNKGDKK